MKLRDKLESFLDGKAIDGTRAISRWRAKKLGHTTMANIKHYRFEAGSRLHGTWHTEGAHVPRLGFIGAHSYLNSLSHIWNEAFIGRYTSIGCRVSIGAARHPMSAVSTSPALSSTARDYTDYEAKSVRQHRNMRRSVVIGSDVWIGDGAIIMPGITISDGAVVGANAVVTKNVAPYEIVGGVPAKTMGRRFSDELAERLLTTQWWEYPHEYLKTCPTGNVFDFLEAFEGGGKAPTVLDTFRIQKAKHAIAALLRFRMGS
ncbi:CatB-related O-acetyltransferase [Sinorhodobacter sp. B57]|nr:CatB-related O-acetyltransferase [Sedimentimonas flavescens]MBW0159710.1 CatB-related O-acetyltransferase [Sedimentimonas flavescens]